MFGTTASEKFIAGLKDVIVLNPNVSILEQKRVCTFIPRERNPCQGFLEDFRANFIRGAC